MSLIEDIKIVLEAHDEGRARGHKEGYLDALSECLTEINGLITINKMDKDRRSPVHALYAAKSLIQSMIDKTKDCK